MCNLGFKFPCPFCLQNSNTRYLELRYPQLCSPGKKAARLNLYERSPDCRHCCLYSQRQSAAMVWESTTVKIVSQAPLNHCCMQIFVHTIMKEVWHKSLHFHLSPRTRDTEEGDRLRWQRAQRRHPRLPARSPSGASPPQPKKARGNLPVAFKAFTQLRRFQKQALKIRNPNLFPVAKWNITATCVLDSLLCPLTPKLLENGDGRDALCLRHGFRAFEQEATSNISPVSCVLLSRYYAKPWFSTQIATIPDSPQLLYWKLCELSPESFRKALCPTWCN